MFKQVFIINGSGGCGKDTFIEALNNQFWKECVVGNYSSIDKVKEIAKAIGWDGTKTERNRKFLNDLKLLTIAFNDMPLNDIKEYTNSFMSNDTTNRILFLHVREPEEIAKSINAFKEYNAKALLVKRDSVKHIVSNMADGNVYDYDYDVVINNNGTLLDLYMIAFYFFKDLLNDSLKKEYDKYTN